MSMSMNKTMIVQRDFGFNLNYLNMDNFNLMYDLMKRELKNPIFLNMFIEIKELQEKKPLITPFLLRSKLKKKFYKSGKCPINSIQQYLLDFYFFGNITNTLVECDYPEQNQTIKLNDEYFIVKKVGIFYCELQSLNYSTDSDNTNNTDDNDDDYDDDCHDKLQD